MKAIVTGDAEYVSRSFDDLRPGAHVAVRASPTQLPDSGLALRLAGFEIRDTIAHIVGDSIVWWILARKPLDGTVAANVLAHGVGGLNIDASRVSGDMSTGSWGGAQNTSIGYGGTEVVGYQTVKNPAGRFPANVLLDEHAAKEMDEQSGVSVSRANTSSDGRKQAMPTAAMNPGVGSRGPSNSHNDSGGASRFFPLLDEDEAENWIRRLIDPDQSA